jgi:translation initiation factor IF-2
MSELNIILKTDVQGSLEAVRNAVLQIGNDEVRPKVVHAGVGGINESDVTLALAVNAVIIGFNVRPETKAIHTAKENHVDIKLYKIIYDLVNEVKLALQGMLKPERREDYLGRAEVRQAFEVSKLGMIAGCMVVDGVITRTASLRLLRDNVVLYEGKVISLKRFKDDAREVKQGFECGVGLEGYTNIKAGDVIEAFTVTEVPKTL